MLEDIVSLLVCSHCGGPLKSLGTSLRCPEGHSFDVARQGYVNLLASGAGDGTADTKEMLDARAAFLSGAAFRDLTVEIADVASQELAASGLGIVADVGAGTGHYLAAVLDACPDRRGLALDISKRAARMAAQSHPRAAAVVADTWSRLPLADSSAALVLAVFAPKNAQEFARVLSPRGALLVVTPTLRHEAELVEALGLLHVDPDKDVRLERSLGPHFVASGSRQVEYKVVLTREQALLAAQMGPTAAHASPEELERRCQSLQAHVEVTVSARLGTYRPLQNGVADS